MCLSFGEGLRFANLVVRCDRTLLLIIQMDVETMQSLLPSGERYEIELYSLSNGVIPA